MRKAKKIGILFDANWTEMNITIYLDSFERVTEHIFLKKEKSETRLDVISMIQRQNDNYKIHWNEYMNIRIKNKNNVYFLNVQQKFEPEENTIIQKYCATVL